MSCLITKYEFVRTHMFDPVLKEVSNTFNFMYVFLLGCNMLQMMGVMMTMLMMTMLVRVMMMVMMMMMAAGVWGLSSGFRAETQPQILSSLGTAPCNQTLRLALLRWGFGLHSLEFGAWISYT